MKHGLTYSLLKILFGVYIIWLGMTNFNEEYSKIKKDHIVQSVDKFHETLNELKRNNLYESVPDFIKRLSFQFPNMFENIKKASEELIDLESFSLILGGILCVFGFSISKGFILIGLLIDLLLVHNYYYYRDERMKVNTLRKIALLAGALYLE